MDGRTDGHAAGGSQQGGGSFYRGLVFGPEKFCSWKEQRPGKGPPGRARRGPRPRRSGPEGRAGGGPQPPLALPGAGGRWRGGKRPKNTRRGRGRPGELPPPFGDTAWGPARPPAATADPPHFGPFPISDDPPGSCRGCGADRGADCGERARRGPPDGRLGTAVPAPRPPGSPAGAQRAQPLGVNGVRAVTNSRADSLN